MKTAMAILTAAVTAGGCYGSRSQDYACRVTSDCESGRVCEQGFCVVSSGDAAIDSPPPHSGDGSASAIDCNMFTSRLFGTACNIPMMGDALSLTAGGAYTLNSDSGALTGPNGPQSNPQAQVVNGIKLLSVAGFSLPAGATLRVVGSQPVAIVSWGTMEIDGTIDASTANATANTPGAGANPATCAQHAAVAGQDDNNGAGGAGGGGFSISGAAGGNGDSGQGGNGGTGTTTPLLAGGCSGAHGGAGENGTPGGISGGGGGAVQLTARTSLVVNGSINASGAGGGGATANGNRCSAGGGGGGTGGMIVLESPSVTVNGSAILAANGGGGGGGCNDRSSGPGGDGALSATQASGGQNGNGGGTGGPGAAGGTAAQVGGSSNTGGGGGGGGSVGYIVVTGAQHALNGTISPPATIQ
jgi:hypothetical protein